MDNIERDMASQWNRLSRKIREEDLYMVDGLMDSARLIETMMDYVPVEGLRDKEVLDFGVGKGRMYRYLRHIFPRLSGYDISREQLKVVQYYESTYGVLTNDLDIFKDERFDVVFTYDTLCYIDKLLVHEAINQMHRVLKKGGLLFVQLYLDEETTPETADYKRKRRYSVHDMRIMFSQFEIIHIADTGKKFHILRRPA
jgi:SAM-dependent methyltransferase